MFASRGEEAQRMARAAWDHDVIVEATQLLTQAARPFS